MAARVSKPSLSPSYKFLVSACLAGVNCTCNGKNNLKKSVKRLVDKGQAIAVCPEVLGGLIIPRERLEIYGGEGRDVLKKKAKVITISGKDVSKHLIDGAEKSLRLAKKHKIKQAILKSRSPSCGYRQIYDGTFRKVLKSGNGVLAALLNLYKIKIYTEKDRIYV